MLYPQNKYMQVANLMWPEDTFALQVTEQSIRGVTIHRTISAPQFLGRRYAYCIVVTCTIHANDTYTQYLFLGPSGFGVGLLAYELLWI